ncbi:hypothetical protein EYC84_007635 [Monilinia fructicola]|uniref:Uncharacterized protein n=1 Tax=Monilinia fructicola TaxID=38448 RepID=A0A5M9JGU8_MONFR|nr:hypothetical protein EYC84_007635 [Monilinia fructicola]
MVKIRVPRRHNPHNRVHPRLPQDLAPDLLPAPLLHQQRPQRLPLAGDQRRRALRRRLPQQRRLQRRHRRPLHVQSHDVHLDAEERHGADAQAEQLVLVRGARGVVAEVQGAREGGDRAGAGGGRPRRRRRLRARGRPRRGCRGGGARRAAHCRVCWAAGARSRLLSPRCRSCRRGSRSRSRWCGVCGGRGASLRVGAGRWRRVGGAPVCWLGCGCGCGMRGFRLGGWGRAGRVRRMRVVRGRRDGILWCVWVWCWERSDFGDGMNRWMDGWMDGLILLMLHLVSPTGKVSGIWGKS